MVRYRRNPQSEKQAIEIKKVFRSLNIRTRTYGKKHGNVEVLVDGHTWKAFASKEDANIVADARREQGYLSRVVKVAGGWAVYRSLTRSLRKIRPHGKGKKKSTFSKPRIHRKTALKWMQMGIISPSAKVGGVPLGTYDKKKKVWVGGKLITEKGAKSVYRKTGGMGKGGLISAMQQEQITVERGKPVVVQRKVKITTVKAPEKAKGKGKGKAPPKAESVPEKKKAPPPAPKKKPGRPKGSGKKSTPAKAPEKAPAKAVPAKKVAEVKKQVKQVAKKVKSLRDDIDDL